MYIAGRLKVLQDNVKLSESLSRETCLLSVPENFADTRGCTGFIADIQTTIVLFFRFSVIAFILVQFISWQVPEKKLFFICL